jgi:hypothetical protein
MCCSRCRTVSYCSPECQAEHAAEHHATCPPEPDTSAMPAPVAEEPDDPIGSADDWVRSIVLCSMAWSAPWRIVHKASADAVNSDLPLCCTHWMQPELDPAAEPAPIHAATQRILRQARSQWASRDGLSTHRCHPRSGCDAHGEGDGCVMDRWKSCTSRYGSMATWHFFYEPVVKPVDGYVSLAKDFTAVTRFVTVDIHLDQDGMCCLRYGTLHGRPSPIDNSLVELLRREVPVFNPVFDDVEWGGYFLPQAVEPRAEGDDGENTVKVAQKQPVLIARAEMCFPLVQLQAVLLGVLPRVAHAHPCRGVSSEEYFGPSAATFGLGVHGPLEGMPFTFYSKEGWTSAADRKVPTSILLKGDDQGANASYPLLLLMLPHEAAFTAGAGSVPATPGTLPDLQTS